LCIGSRVLLMLRIRVCSRNRLFPCRRHLVNPNSSSFRACNPPRTRCGGFDGLGLPVQCKFLVAWLACPVQVSSASFLSLGLPVQCRCQCRCLPWLACPVQFLSIAVLSGTAPNITLPLPCHCFRRSLPLFCASLFWRRRLRKIDFRSFFPARRLATRSSRLFLLLRAVG